MIIDAHQHFWNPARGDYGWMEGNDAVAAIRKPFLPADLEPMLQRHAIAKTVLVQAAPSLEETEYMLGLADATASIAKVVGWINFEDKSQRASLERLARHPKFAGMRPMIQDIPDPGWMLKPEVQWAYEAIIEHGLTFDALGFPLHLENFRLLFRRYPSMKVVVDHGMKPRIRDQAFGEWAGGIALLATETSALCKISGLATEAAAGWNAQTLRPYVDHLLKCFGPKRLMWGSDWPVLELAGAYSQWFETARALVPAEDHADVFGGTAAGFYAIT